MIIDSFIREMEEIVGKAHVSVSRATTELYSYDASLAKGKPGVVVFPADTDETVRVVRIVAIGTRRGPAPEAQALYEDLTAPQNRDNFPPAPRYEGKGRPTKRDRRKLDLKRLWGSGGA